MEQRVAAVDKDHQQSMQELSATIDRNAGLLREAVDAAKSYLEERVKQEEAAREAAVAIAQSQATDALRRQNAELRSLLKVHKYWC